MLKKLINSKYLDNCKKCGCSNFECKNCNNHEFYRYLYDKKRMRLNLRIIRNKGLPIITIKCFSCNENFEVVEHHSNKSYLIHDCKLYEQLYQNKKITKLTVIKGKQ